MVVVLVYLGCTPLAAEEYIYLFVQCTDYGVQRVYLYRVLGHRVYLHHRIQIKITKLRQTKEITMDMRPGLSNPPTSNDRPECDHVGAEQPPDQR